MLLTGTYTYTGVLTYVYQVPRLSVWLLALLYSFLSSVYHTYRLVMVRVCV